MARHRILLLFFGMALAAAASMMLAISKHILTPIHMLAAGTVLITLYIIPYLPPLKADMPTTSGKILLAILCIAFYIRTFIVFAIPYFAGFDTAHYIASSLYFAKNWDEVPATLIFSTETMHIAFPWGEKVDYPFYEPLSYFLFASTIKLGLPPMLIPLLIVPFFSTITLLPFFLLVRRVSDGRTALVATALLTFSPMQFRMMLDLYKNVIANFFLFCSLYFFMAEKSRIPYRSLASATLLFATSIPMSALLMGTIGIHSIVKKDSRELRRLALIVFAALLLSLAPIRVFNAFDPILKTGEKVTPSLMDMMKELDFGRVFFPLVPLAIFTLPVLKDYKKQNFELALLLSTVAFAIPMLFLKGLFVSRPLFMLEFSLAIFAAISIGALGQAYYFLTAIAWLGWETLFYVKVWYQPWPAVWQAFEGICEGMPEIHRSADIHSWVFYCLLFTIAVICIYALGNHLYEQGRKE